MGTASVEEVKLSDDEKNYFHSKFVSKFMSEHSIWPHEVTVKEKAVSTNGIVLVNILCKVYPDTIVRTFKVKGFLDKDRTNPT